jgi:hypothetical protein
MYFSFPIVKLQTIDVSAAPSAPESAATLPPPGAGLLDASSERNHQVSLKQDNLFPQPYNQLSFFWFKCI